MIQKYRVHEIAKDFGVQSKDIIEIIKKYTGEEKKHMTALTEHELNIVFEYFSQKVNYLENIEDYFNMKIFDNNKNNNIKNNNKNINNSEEDKNKNKKNINKNINNIDKKFVKKIILDNLSSKKESVVSVISEKDVISENNIVNTRVENVDKESIDKYNEKYDRLAYDKIHNDNKLGGSNNKQKIVQKSQQRNKFKTKKETENEKLNRIAEERKARPMTVMIPDEITVGELALRLKLSAVQVIKKLMSLGVMASVNDNIDFDTASIVAMEFHAKVEKEEQVSIEEMIIDSTEDAEENLVSRAPVVVVMGHVDHGKTSLLDAIKNSNVTDSEAGGITQHIGAYRVFLNNNNINKEITFLDTPGHEAFTTMRARGAQVTDIAILVVAADDGIKPQTIEAINHAKAAEVSIIVAINKIDKPDANPDRVLQQLTEHNLLPEEWGGDVPCIRVSAVTKQGIDELLEMILLVSEVKELKANPNRKAKGTVIEARLDKGRGPVATILVQNGTLRTGDIIVAGMSVGKVRAMTNDKNVRIKEAGPSVPVEITGLDTVPSGGDTVNAVSNEKLARELVEQRRLIQKESNFASSKTVITLDNLFDQMKSNNIKELKIIVKADVQGSVEAVKESLNKISNSEVKVNIIHGAVGAINESDVMLANASNAIIVGFNVRPEPAASENAQRYGVDMRTYRIIYECIEEIQQAMKGMLAPKYREVILGRVECREVYKVSSIGTIAGCHVLSGKITRNSKVRVLRDGIVIFETELGSLKRFKDDVKEVAQGYDCGLSLVNFNDIKIKDIFEIYTIEEYRD